jgi:hypothetical protein
MGLQASWTEEVGPGRPRRSCTGLGGILLTQFIRNASESLGISDTSVAYLKATPPDVHLAYFRVAK